MSVFAGQASTFVASPAATGNMQVEFSQNPASFPINQYIKLVPLKKSRGKYVVIDRNKAIRFRDRTLNEHRWRDGDDAPRGNGVGLEWKDVSAERYAFPWEIGEIASEDADFDLIAALSRIESHKAMTGRAIRVSNLLTTSANWPSTNTGTATAVGGGTFAAATTTTPYIQQTFNAVQNAITLQSNGIVQPSDLMCVVDANGARSIVQSAEYRSWFQNNQYAMNLLQHASPTLQKYGLVPMLHGIRMVIDETVVGIGNENTANTTPTRGMLYSGLTTVNTVAVFMSRPGGLIGADGVPQFSTLTVFAKEDMTVETKRDADNRRMLGRVVDNTDEVLTAPVTGFYLTNLAG